MTLEVSILYISPEEGEFMFSTVGVWDRREIEPKCVVCDRKRERNNDKKQYIAQVSLPGPGTVSTPLVEAKSDPSSEVSSVSQDLSGLERVAEAQRCAAVQCVV